MTIQDSQIPISEKPWRARWQVKLRNLMASSASPHATEPDFWRDLRDELLAGRQWVDRAVVPCCATITGLVVVAFTLRSEQASHVFSALTGAGGASRYLPLVWTPTLTVALLWWTRRFAPGAMGSGIPQVVRALDDDLPQAHRSWLVSLRLSVHKMGLVSAGLAGGLFSRLIVVSARGSADVFSRARLRCPLRFAAACGVAVAEIGIVTGGATAGAGDAPTRAMLDGQAEIPGLFTLLKFCATWLSAWTGVPAGVFAPSLTFGAGIGHDVALLVGVEREVAIPLIALGMVGFLAATTQGPITAFIIVMEMVSGHTMVLSLMACARVASGVARLLTKPMYGELAALHPLLPLPTDDPITAGRRSDRP